MQIHDYVIEKLDSRLQDEILEELQKVVSSIFIKKCVKNYKFIEVDYVFDSNLRYKID